MTESELQFRSLAGAMPVMAAAKPDQCWPLGLESSGTRRPLNTFNFLRKGSSGFNWTVISQSVPAFLGIHNEAVRPQPQKKVLKRVGSGRPLVWACPLLFKKQSRKGSPITATAPWHEPRRRVRRLSFIRSSFIVPPLPLSH